MRRCAPITAYARLMSMAESSVFTLRHLLGRAATSLAEIPEPSVDELVLRVLVSHVVKHLDLIPLTSTRATNA